MVSFSPDLKQGMYSEGEQCTSLNGVWEAVIAAAPKVVSDQFKKLTGSVNGRFVTAIEKKRGYIGH